jgi:hypothetical protein
MTQAKLQLIHSVDEALSIAIEALNKLAILIPAFGTLSQIRR